jgi:hypothetical protein
MVVEHTFVTTLEPADALHRASEFLARHGFSAVTTGGFAVGDTQWTGLKMSRGKKLARSAKSVSQLPQMLRLDYDRGRVTLAISITPSGVWGRGRFGSDPKPDSKHMRLHTAMLTAIASGLELLLVQKLPLDQTAAQWDAAEASIELATRRHRRNMWIAAAIILLIFGGLIALVIVANSH